MIPERILSFLRRNIEGTITEKPASAPPIFNREIEDCLEYFENNPPKFSKGDRIMEVHGIGGIRGITIGRTEKGFFFQIPGREPNEGEHRDVINRIHTTTFPYAEHINSRIML